MNIKQKAREVGIYATLACLLEVTTEKPGNVTPKHDFTDAKFENFLFGSIIISKAVEKAFMDGFKGNFKIGKRIYEFIRELKTYNKTNTHFGIALLFIPIATALGVVEKGKSKKNKSEKSLKNMINFVMEKTNVDDAIYLHKAVLLCNVRVNTRDIGKFDILSKNFVKIAKREGATLYYLMNISAEKDLIARELTTKADISFTYLNYLHSLSGDVSVSRKNILQLYLLLLSKFQDTLIMKKHGSKISKNVSDMAQDVINGNLSVEKFSDYLYVNNINPGTIADITANVIFLYLLFWRPRYIKI